MTFEPKDLILAGSQIVTMLLAALVLYYRLKAQTDANTKDITAILREMGDNGFVKRIALDDQWRIAKEIHQRQDETIAQINEEIGRMRTTMESMQAALRRRAVE